MPVGAAYWGRLAKDVYVLTISEYLLQSDTEVCQRG